MRQAGPVSSRAGTRRRRDRPAAGRNALLRRWARPGAGDRCRRRRDDDRSLRGGGMGQTHWAWGLAAATLAWPLQAQEARPGLAVLPFENTGSYGPDKDVFEAFQMGLPAMRSSALAAHPGLRVVDASRVRQELDAQRVRSRERVDAATAGQV